MILLVGKVFLDLGISKLVADKQVIELKMIV